MAKAIIDDVQVTSDWVSLDCLNDKLVTAKPACIRVKLYTDWDVYIETDYTNMIIDGDLSIYGSGNIFDSFDYSLAEWSAISNVSSKELSNACIWLLSLFVWTKTKTSI